MIKIDILIGRKSKTKEKKHFHLTSIPSYACCAWPQFDFIIIILIIIFVIIIIQCHTQSFSRIFILVILLPFIHHIRISVYMNIRTDRDKMRKRTSILIKLMRTQIELVFIDFFSSSGCSILLVQ